MSRAVYRYEFVPDVPLEEIEGTLLLAIFAAESVHGESQVRLDAAHHFDLDRHVCVIDTGTAVGRDLNKLFVGFFTREFGPDAFRVERVARDSHRQPQEAGAPHGEGRSAGQGGAADSRGRPEPVTSNSVSGVEG